jgi:DNA polymerase III subunit epsilon
MLSSELLGFYRQLSQQDLTIVDLETTGIKPPYARVTEISVIQANLKQGIKQQQTHLMNAGVRVPEQITRITGISQAMVTAAAPADAVWPLYLPLLSQGILTAHNIGFDYPFLKSELQQLGVTFHRPASEQLCTVILSRILLPELPSRSLPDLVKHFGFKVGRSHRAEADTMACWLLAQHLLTVINEEPEDLLLKKFGQQWIPLREAAQILQCRQPEAQHRLAQVGVEPRRSTKGQGVMYRRYQVEQLLEGLAD